MFDVSIFQYHAARVAREGKTRAAKKVEERISIKAQTAPDTQAFSFHKTVFLKTGKTANIVFKKMWMISLKKKYPRIPTEM